MEKIHESKYQLITFDKEIQIIHNIWYDATRNMTEGEFRNEINFFEQEIRRNNPKLILGDPSNLNFPISPEIQNCIAENLFITISNIRVTKYAVTVPKDLITQLSVEQTVKGEKTGDFIMKYFDDLNLAKEWLLEA